MSTICTVRSGIVIEAATDPASSTTAAPARLWLICWQDESGFGGTAHFEGLPEASHDMHALPQPLELTLAAMTAQEMLAATGAADSACDVFDAPESFRCVLRELLRLRRGRTRGFTQDTTRALREALLSYESDLHDASEGDFEILMGIAREEQPGPAATRLLGKQLSRFFRWKEAPEVSAWRAAWPQMRATLLQLGQQRLAEQAQDLPLADAGREHARQRA